VRCTACTSPRLLETNLMPKPKKISPPGGGTRSASPSQRSNRSASPSQRSQRSARKTKKKKEPASPTSIIGAIEEEAVALTSVEEVSVAVTEGIESESPIETDVVAEPEANPSMTSEAMIEPASKVVPSEPSAATEAPAIRALQRVVGGIKLQRCDNCTFYHFATSAACPRCKEPSSTLTYVVTLD